jgi:hypothetical protein
MSGMAIFRSILLLRIGDESESGGEMPGSPQ